MDAKDKIIEDLQQHLRENLPPERIDETFDYGTTDEDVQRLDLTPTAEFETYQFIELPESPVFVSEHRMDEVRSSLQQFHHRNVHGSPKCGSCQEKFLQSRSTRLYVRLSSRVTPGKSAWKG